MRQNKLNSCTELLKKYVGAKGRFTSEQAGAYYDMLCVQAAQDGIKIDSFTLEPVLQKVVMEHEGFGVVDVKAIYREYKAQCGPKTKHNEPSKRDQQLTEILHTVNAYNMVLLQLIAVDGHEDIKGEFRIIYKALKTAIENKRDLRSIKAEVGLFEQHIIDAGDKYIDDSGALDQLTAHYYCGKKLQASLDTDEVKKMVKVFRELECIECRSKKWDYDYSCDDCRIGKRGEM